MSTLNLLRRIALNLIVKSNSQNYRNLFHSRIPVLVSQNLIMTKLWVELQQTMRDLKTWPATTCTLAETFPTLQLNDLGRILQLELLSTCTCSKSSSTRINFSLNSQRTVINHSALNRLCKVNSKLKIKRDRLTQGKNYC